MEMDHGYSAGTRRAVGMRKRHIGEEATQSPAIEYQFRLVNSPIKDHFITLFLATHLPKKCSLSSRLRARVVNQKAHGLLF